MGSPRSGTAPLTVDFTDLSTNNPTSWTWAFGDGGTSTAQNPSHTYAVGTYTVALMATNARGSDTETKVNYITVTPPAVPIAEFAGSPTSGTVPLTVSFTDLSSNSPTAWTWSFGDGDSSSVRNPDHTYHAAGTYTVTLESKIACEFATLAGPEAFDVVPLNLATLAAADREAATAFQNKVRQLHRAVSGACKAAA